MAAATVVFALLVLVFAALARGLSRVYVTAPLAFVAAGAVISTVTSRPSVETVLQIKTVAEVALALILFHDAAHVRPRHIGREADSSSACCCWRFRSSCSSVSLAPG